MSGKSTIPATSARNELVGTYPRTSQDVSHGRRSLATVAAVWGSARRNERRRRVSVLRSLLFLTALAVLASDSYLMAAKIAYKDGRILEGKVGLTGTIAEDPLNPDVTPGGVDVRPILILDDQLRRTYTSKRLAINIDHTDTAIVKIKVKQNVANVGAPVGAVGPLINRTRFSAFGRCIYSMNTVKGPLDVVLGITEITPRYTRVQGLMGPRKPIVWDRRIATTSIPQDTLTSVLKLAVPQDDAQARMSVVRLYLQSEQYRLARLELEQIISDFPDLGGMEAEVRELRQMGARRALRELQLRGKAGQHQQVKYFLTNFPAEEVAGETLQQVREMLADYKKKEGQLARIAESLKKIIGQVGPALQPKATQVSAEILSNLNLNNISRLTAFLLLAESKDLSAEEKAALAISGWLIGSRGAIDNLPVALSLAEVRDEVRTFLRAPTRRQRDQVISNLASREAATPEQVAKLLAHMTPPLDVPPLADQQVYGFYELSVPGIHEDPDIRYLVQLPPEYDPYRRYPAIITLNGTGSSPELQLDFWAGDVVWRGEKEQRSGVRMGQSMRHGYVTIAIDWRRQHQFEYGYSVREHHAILSALRDACRRFSLDTDRIFLSGHNIGGNAVWDIGLAHPDVWAGVIPIVARSDRYCAHYWPNARYVPLYVVAGEFDGSNMKDNSRDLDRCLRRGFDTTVVEFLGRGHEPFNDEIQRIFDWMNRRRRERPKEFECATMRPADRFFWWLEVDGMPEKAMVHPADWPPPRNPRPLTLRATNAGNNAINVRTGTRKTTVWLSPDFINFQERIAVTINGRRAAGGRVFIKPDLAILLEDARARAERQHPFWAKVEVP